MELPIDSIVVRVRSRSSLGNVTSLAESIRQRGLLHLPVVRRDGDDFVLVAGARRLAALRQLGVDRVQVRVIATITDELSALMAEGEENTEREPFSPSDAVRQAERLHEFHAAAAKERKREHGGTAPGRPSTSSTVDEVSSGRTDDKVAAAVGMARTTLRRAQEVVATANDPDQPEEVRAVAQAAVAEMDATGKVKPAYRKVEQAKADANTDSGPSRLPAAARAEQIEALAAQALSSRQIADRLGIGDIQVRNIARAQGIEIPADKVVGRTRRLDSNRIVRGTVDAVDGIDVLFDQIDYSTLDGEQLHGWVVSLTGALRSLTTLKSNLTKEMTSRDER